MLRTLAIQIEDTERQDSAVRDLEEMEMFVDLTPFIAAFVALERQWRADKTVYTVEVMTAFGALLDAGRLVVYVDAS